MGKGWCNDADHLCCRLQLEELLRELRAEDANCAVEATVQDLTEVLLGLPSCEVWCEISE